MKSKWVLTLLAGSLLASPLALSQSTTPLKGDYATAYFAGGCFWSIESGFEKHKGVIEARSGFMGGKTPNPTSDQVATQTTGHRETVEVRYDPKVTSYQELVNLFWRLHDPSDAGGSFYDRGGHYTSAIFAVNDEQRSVAEGSKKALQASGKFKAPIATAITPAKTFYLAEDFHQDYYKKQPGKYNSYRVASGRDAYYEKTWKGDKTVYQVKSSSN